MDTERPPAHRRPPDRETAGQAGDGYSSYETAGLGLHIVARYGRSPGVIPMEATLQRFRRTGLFGHDRLPLLTRLSRRWGGVNLPYPGSGAPLTFLQASPFASAGFAGAERIGRPIVSATTGTVDPGAPSSVPVTPRGPLPRARETWPSTHETGKRMITERAIAPSASAATETGSAIVRRRRSQRSDPSPDPANGPPARRPAATSAATAAPVGTVVRPAEAPPHGPLPLSPADSNLGRPIIRRRKHASSEPLARTTTSVTTETEPPLRLGPHPGKEESTIRRTAMPLPVAGERLPSTRGSAPASPAPTPEPAPREEPSTIETSDAATFRGDLGAAIQSRYANTTVATSTEPLAVSMTLPRQSRPSRVDQSVENAPAVAENRPGTSTPTASETITVPSPTMAYPIPGLHAATERSHGEQPIRMRDPGRRSRSADRPPTAAPPTQPTVFRTLADTARPDPTAPGAAIGSAEALPLARSPLPLAPLPLEVRREPQHFSAEQTPRGPSPTTAWRTGDGGQSPFAIGAARAPTGQGSGSVTAVPIEDSGVGTEVEPNPPAAGDGERPNVDDLVDKVLRKLMRRLTVEQERRGRQRWF